MRQEFEDTLDTIANSGMPQSLFISPRSGYLTREGEALLITASLADDPEAKKKMIMIQHISF
jgi:hypothetical protein